MSETHRSERGAICPHCGHLNSASDSDGILYDESLCEYECGECEKTFRVRANVTWMWETFK